MLRLCGTCPSRLHKESGFKIKIALYCQHQSYDTVYFCRWISEQSTEYHNIYCHHVISWSQAMWTQSAPSFFYRDAALLPNTDNICRRIVGMEVKHYTLQAVETSGMRLKWTSQFSCQNLNSDCTAQPSSYIRTYLTVHYRRSYLEPVMVKNEP